MLSLDEIFSLLVTTVGVSPASTLVETLKRKNMNGKPYESMGTIDERLPAFDKGFVFECSPEPSVTARFEILETQGDILQAGLIVTCPRKLFFSKAAKYYNAFVRLSDAHYGQGAPINAEIAKSMNYGDATTICYVSRSRLGDVDIVAIRVGNREHWG